MSEFDQKLGMRLRLLRQMKRISLECMGMALDVSTQQVQKYEAGSNRISPERLQKCAAFLDVPIGYFFGTAGDDRAAESMATAMKISEISSEDGPEDHVDYASCKDFPEDPVRGMHDVVAMAYLVNPELFKLKKFPITVVTTPSFSGQTLIGKPDHPAVNVVMDLNRSELLKRMIQNLRNLP